MYSISLSKIHSREFVTLALILVLGPNPAQSQSFQFPRHNHNENDLSSTMVLHTCCPINLEVGGEIKCGTIYQKENSVISSSLMIPGSLTAEDTAIHFRTAPQENKGCLDSEMDTIVMSWSKVFKRDTFFLKNGYLQIQNHYYHRDEYCINGINETSLEILVCPQTCTGPRPCIYKCCGLDKVYNFGFTPNAPRKGCQSSGSDYFAPKLFKEFEQGSTAKKGSETLGPHYIQKYPSAFKYECDQNFTTLFVNLGVVQVVSSFTSINFTGHPIKIREDGRIMYQDLNKDCRLVPDDINFCVDGIINYSPEMKTFHNDPEELVVFMCSASPDMVWDRTDRVKEQRTGEGCTSGGTRITNWTFLTLAILSLIVNNNWIENTPPLLAKYLSTQPKRLTTLQINC